MKPPIRGLRRKKVKPGRRLLAVRASPDGAVTYSPASAVPSARRGLTSLFGMGRGGSHALCLDFLFPGRGPSPARYDFGEVTDTAYTLFSFGCYQELFV